MAVTSNVQVDVFPIQLFEHHGLRWIASSHICATSIFELQRFTIRSSECKDVLDRLGEFAEMASCCFREDPFDWISS